MAPRSIDLISKKKIARAVRFFLISKKNQISSCRGAHILAFWFSFWRSQVYLGGFQVVCMLLMVVREKCEVTFPLIGGSASVYALFRQ